MTESAPVTPRDIALTVESGFVFLLTDSPSTVLLGGVSDGSTEDHPMVFLNRVRKTNPSMRPIRWYSVTDWPAGYELIQRRLLSQGYERTSALVTEQGFSFEWCSAPPHCDISLCAASMTAQLQAVELLRAVSFPEERLYFCDDRFAESVEARGVLPVVGVSPSVQVCGLFSPEYDRTVLSLKCIDWVMNGEYDSFVECQNPAIKLSQGSFDELRAEMETIDVPLVRSTLALHDLGKSKFARDAAALLGCPSPDHDDALVFILRHPTACQAFPTYVALTESQRVHCQALLSSPLNLGQLLQGECGASALANLDTTELLKAKVAMGTFDIAGAAGHVKQNGSASFIEPFFKARRSTVAALLECEAQDCVQRYHSVLKARSVLIDIPFTPDNIPMIRLCMMLRQDRPGPLVNVVSQALEILTDADRALLSAELTPRARGEILMYYSPAVLQAATSPKVEDKEGSLGICLGILCHVLRLTRELAGPSDSASYGSFVVNVGDITVADINARHQLDAIRVVQTGPTDAKVVISKN